MRAFKCDKCGQLVEGTSGTSNTVLEQEGSTKDWARSMEKIIVRVQVSPSGDPSGYGGIELCKACVREIVAIVTEGRVKPKRSAR